MYHDMMVAYTWYAVFPMIRDGECATKPTQTSEFFISLPPIHLISSSLLKCIIRRQGDGLRKLETQMIDELGRNFLVKNNSTVSPPVCLHKAP